MTEFVVGFLFSRNLKRVVLMEKRRPDWQVGLLNGPGGKIKMGEEMPAQAMTREFEEETGVHLSPLQWRDFCTLKHASGKLAGNRVFFYTARADVEVKQMTDEQVRWYDLEADDFPVDKLVKNLFWLFPLAVDESLPFAAVSDAP